MMTVQTRAAVIGFGVAFVGGAICSFAGGGLISVLPAVFLGAAVWFVLSMLANNRTVGTATDQERAAALASPPPDGSGLLYVYREGFMGRQLGFDLALDGRTVAQLRSPRFARLIVPAGEHTLAAGTQGFAASQNQAGQVSFVAKPGETVVFALRVERGMTRNSLKFERESEPETALRRLANVPMVLPDAEPANRPGS